MIRRGSIKLPDIGNAVPNGRVGAQMANGANVRIGVQMANGGPGANMPKKFFNSEEDSPPPSYTEIDENNLQDLDTHDAGPGKLLNSAGGKNSSQHSKKKEIIDVESLNLGGIVGRRTNKRRQENTNSDGDNVTTVYL